MGSFFNGVRVSVREDEKVLKIIDDGCTAVLMYLISLNYILNS